MLYQQTRPSTLDEFVGSKDTIKALANAIESENHAHVYLMQGPSGCGKTTLARILAKDFGAAVHNIIEKNAASDRGIDMARDLQKYATLGPIGGGSRAIILDECHRLTKDASSALLKVLEDVPDFQYYFLCTTEPQTLLKTIRTRCEKVTVSLLDDDDMYDCIVNAAERANIHEPPEEVLDAIVESAKGCPREALVLLEKQDGLDEDQALSAVKSHETITRTTKALCQALVKGDTWTKVMATYAKLEDKDVEGTRRVVLGYLSACLKGAKKKSEMEKFANMLEELTEHTYDAGEPKLMAMLYRAWEAGR